jgi:hypothetical protein
VVEVRYTDPLTGGMKGQKSERLGGADPLALAELARVYGMGEQKYARYNYLKGYPWSLSVDALFRHLVAFLAGEERDPESGLLHTAHVAWHALTLTSFQQRRVGTDDRAPLKPEPDYGWPTSYDWYGNRAPQQTRPCECDPSCEGAESVGQESSEHDAQTRLPYDSLEISLGAGYPSVTVHAHDTYWHEVIEGQPCPGE